MKSKIAIIAAEQRNRYNFFVYTEEPEPHVGQPVIMVPDNQEQGAPPAPPTMVLSVEAMKDLFEQLWQHGFRPAHYEMVTNETLQRHVDRQKELIDQQSKMIGDLLTEVERLSAPIITMTTGGKK